MKKKHGFVRRLRYLGLAGIIVFGFMTIVATGDGGDSGDSGGGPIAPIIDVISDTSATEGTPYTGPTPSLSQGTLPVTWSLVSGPSGMNVDSSTGVVSWPDPTVSGSPHLITIRATNTAGSDDESWQLTVTSSPISPAAGQWCGSPGDLTVDFVVASGGDGLEEITIKFTDFSCGGSISNGSITFSSSPPYPIIDSSFEESFALSGNKTVTIKGTFNSTQSASGTYEAVFYGDTCTETWDAAQESGAACAPPSYDATGTWSTVETETYNSDGEFLEVKHGTATISQTNSSFKLEADEGEIFDGTVCGTVYTFSGSWEMQEPGGQWGTATMEGSVELTSEINFEGNFTFTWTNGTHIYSEKWDVVGTK